MIETIVGIVAMVVVGIAHWAIYTALLWIMIKIQKLNFNWLGLLGSSALASAIDYIPVVGPYLGWVVLVICLQKVTQADIAPDVLFTVAIAGSLMFCVNLFLLGSLMGTLHFAGYEEPMDDDGTLELVDSFDKSVRPTEASNDDDDDDPDAEPKPAVKASPKPLVATARPATKPVVSVKQTAPVAAKPSSPVVAAKPVATKVAAVSEENIRDASSLPAKLFLKGLAMNSSQRTAMITDGREIHTVAVGEFFSVPSPSGTLVLRCEDINNRGVILALDKGDRVRLTFQ